jgi:hypothetical protein
MVRNRLSTHTDEAGTVVDTESIKDFVRMTTVANRIAWFILPDEEASCAAD